MADDDTPQDIYVIAPDGGYRSYKGMSRNAVKAMFGGAAITFSDKKTFDQKNSVLLRGSPVDGSGKVMGAPPSSDQIAALAKSHPDKTIL